MMVNWENDPVLLTPIWGSKRCIEWESFRAYEADPWAGPGWSNAAGQGGGDGSLAQG